MNIICKYASLVKFGHTVFALPFALMAYVYALRSTATPFDAWLLVKILACMVLARNAAMGFNRWADRHIDAENPRTAAREIPSGRISPQAALAFVAANAVGFMFVAALINGLTFALSPLALFIILSYTYVKRYSAWVHVVLGISLAIAPVGAYIAVTGYITFVPLLLAGCVITWVSGFDILYSLQDAEFDRSHGLHSVPVRLTPRGAVWVSIVLHAATVYTLAVIGMSYPTGIAYKIGACIFTAVLIAEHVMFTPGRAGHIGAWFGLMNGMASTAYALLAILDMLVR